MRLSILNWLLSIRNIIHVAIVYIYIYIYIYIYYTKIINNNKIALNDIS